MKQIREELDGILLETYRLKDLSELLADYFFTHITGPEHTKGDTLVTILNEKVQALDKSLSKLYDDTHEIQVGNN